MGRAAAVAAAFVLLAGCSDGDRAAVPPPPPAPSTSPEALVTPDLEREARELTFHENAAHEPLWTGDLDGDRLADVIEVVESTTDHSRDDWRWGLRAHLSTLGPQTAWAEYGEGANDAHASLQSPAGFARDVDRDGRDEVFVVAGTTSIASAYDLVRVVDGRLVRVRGRFDLWSARVLDIADSFGCEGGLLYVATARARGGVFRGTREYFRLAGARALRVRTESDSWREGAPPPHHYVSHGEC